MLGYDVGDIPQSKNSWFGLIHPKDRKKTQKVVKEYLENKGERRYENTFRLKRKDNTWCWILGRGKAKFDEDGKPLRFVGFNTDISAQIEYQQKLDHIAKHDPLTQLPNRFLLSKLLTSSMNSTKKSKEYLALLFIDLDGFKEVNDIYGHDVGDEVLLKISSNMKKIIQANNILSRIGGDEFVIVTPKLKHYNDIVPLIKRVLADISTPIIINNKKISISASIGVSFYPQAQDIGNEVLMRQADQAMYEAKLAGKNQYKFFNIEASVEIIQQQQYITNLFDALRDNEFTLHYQPKVDMSTNKPIGYEALLRWNHPEDGILYPDSFLPYVENESDFMVELGKWVFEHAFSQLDDWNSQGLDTTLSINVSPYELQQKDFCAYLIDLLSTYPNIKADMLEFEILESAAFDNFTQTTQVLHNCQELGVNIAIDDFGTGYASLHYLKKFPMNVLKIDKSFVIDLLSTSQNISIVESSIGLAHAFNAHVIAEGVESEEHGILLRQLGCERAQGYAIAKAMPGSDVIEWNNSYKGFDSWAKARPIDPNDKIILHVSTEHKNWIKNIEDYINNKTDKLPHMSTSQCFLGNWLIHEATDSQRLNPEFDSIVKLHEKLHDFSEELLLFSDKNKQDGIKRLYEMRDTMLKKLKSFI
jgi:diguanylate cyclase (GGDEF)-like protein/PAS domain S-box-containing protein